MINQTRITVDQATKKVLDDLSGHLSQPPSWVAPLSDEIQEVGEATRNALTATTKSVAKINDAVATLQEQIVSQAESHAESQASALADLSGAMKGIGEHLDALEAGIRNQSQSVGDMLASNERACTASAQQGQAIALLQQKVEGSSANTEALRSTGEALTQQLTRLLGETRTLAGGAERHDKRLADLQGGNERLLAVSEQGTAAAIQQRDIVQAMSEALQAANQQQEKRATELIAALQSTNALLRELQSEQVKQRDALQSVAERVESLSKPWWKKLF
jgi:chromosome segregation ATPase